MGNTNRTKGNNAERLYAKEFKKMGFEDCVTSRYGSKQHDDAGIDLINLPFNVQIKAGKQTEFRPPSVLQITKERVKTMFSKSSAEQKKTTIAILHKMYGKGKKRRTEYDQLVFMTFEDFKKLLNKIEKWD